MTDNNELYMKQKQRRKAREFVNALAIYDDAKKAYENHEINLDTLKRIAEQLDL